MSDITIQNLTELIDEHGKEKVQQLLSTFKSRNDDVESFLINNALRFNKDNLSRTYLLLETDDISTKLRGYISLSFKTIQIDSNVTVTSGEKKRMGVSPKIDSFITLLIGQYGKNENEGHVCDPKLLLGYAVDLSIDIQNRVGGLTTVLLECDKTNDKLNEYYKGLGFQSLQISNDLSQYYIFINRGQKLLESIFQINV